MMGSGYERRTEPEPPAGPRLPRAPRSGERSWRPAHATGSLQGSAETARRPALTNPGDKAGGDSPPHGRGGRGTGGLGDRRAAWNHAPPGERPNLCDGHEHQDLETRELPGHDTQCAVGPGRGKGQRGAGAHTGRGTRSTRRHSPLLSHSLGVAVTVTPRARPRRLPSVEADNKQGISRYIGQPCGHFASP
jgi:hypothetical protein